MMGWSVMAKMQPSRMPATIDGFNSAPISPRSLYRTYLGAIMTHTEESQPFVNANKERFKSLNQSALNSHCGPTSKAIAMMIGTNTVREYCSKSVVLRLSCIILMFAAIRPIVSQALNSVRVVRTNQLYLCLVPSRNLKLVSWTMPGKTMKVRQKAYDKAGSSPFVRIKFFPALLNIRDAQQGRSDGSATSSSSVYNGSRFALSTLSVLIDTSTF